MAFNQELDRLLWPMHHCRPAPQAAHTSISVRQNRVFPASQVTAVGRKGDVANGRLVELQFAEHSFAGMAAMEKADWLKWVAMQS